MADPIRPNLTPVLRPTTPAAPQKNAQALAAQRAFFQAALGQAAPAAAPAPPVQTQAVQPARATVSTAKPTPTAEPQPARYARPGSIVDIKV
jgi:hypothetical protein